MYQNLKSEIKEIIEIVKQCPDTLQEKCFELLLDNYLKSNDQPKTKKATTKVDEPSVESTKADETKVEMIANKEEEIVLIPNDIWKKNG